MQQWKLREEVYRSFHQWMYLAVFALIGAAAGLGVSFIIRTPYEATSELYVGLEAYRAYADPHFSAEANQEYTNLDDYKNWQMAQLDELVITGEFLDDTLAVLRQRDPYWNGVTKQGLRAMLRAEWRTAGKWTIIARHEDAKQAFEASQAWSEVIVERANRYIEESQNMMLIDLQMQQAAQDAGAAKSRLAVLKQASRMIEDYERRLHEMAAGKAVDGLLRSQMLSLAAILADYTPAWQDLLAHAPAIEDPGDVYVDYLAQMRPLIAAEEQLMQAQYEERMESFNLLSLDYVCAVKESHGLSANLEVRRLDTDMAPVVTNPHSGAFYALCGAMLAICAWIMLQIIIVSRRVTRHE